MVGGYEKNQFQELRIFGFAVTLVALGWGCDSDDARPETPVAADPLPAEDDDVDDADEPDDDADEPDDDNGSTTGNDEPEPEPEPDDGGSTGEPTEPDEDEPDIVYTGPGCGITPVCDKGEFVGSIRIQSSDQIEDIAGYTSMTGWLEVVDSDLECLDFLYCMEEVGRDLSIFGNPDLKDLAGLDSLTALGVSTTSAGYNEWDGSLVISNNPSLVVLNGFASLPETQESLNINRNDALERVVGFDGFRTVQHNLVVRDNPLLESIEGLGGLELVRGKFLVTQNPNLCLSEVNVLGDSLIEFPGDGGTTAANNAGC